MALIQCRECGAQISSKAAACPACGLARGKRTSWLTWLVAILLVPGLIAFLASLGQDGGQERDPDQRYYHTARRFIEGQLKAPSTAKFSNVLTDEHTGVVEMGNGIWQAFGSVDAENAFGARLRQNWRTIFEPTAADTLHFLYWRLGSQSVGDRGAAEARAKLTAAAAETAAR